MKGLGREGRFCFCGEGDWGDIVDRGLCSGQISEIWK